jgi:uncharacterized protein YrrD
MLRNTLHLDGYAIRATDGDIGHVKDFYFDDEAWVVRYFVVETGSWMNSRRVLISPIAIGRPSWTENVLPVSLTKERVQNSPDIDTARPVSRQHEMQHLGYYGYPYYWGGEGLWGAGAFPELMLTVTPQAASPANTKDDIHLRSCNALHGYAIHATDGDIGHVTGLLLDDASWAIRYLVIETGSWWLGHQVLVAPYWIEGISWADSAVSVDLPRQAIKDAPQYDSNVVFDRTLEMELYAHYGRAGYWTQEPARHRPAA